MRVNIYSAILFLLVSNHFAFAQSEVLFPFFIDQVSIPLIAAGHTGTANLTTDAIGFYYNPAQLGYSSRYNNFAFSFMPSKTNLPAFLPITTRSYGFQVGYDFNKIDKSIPLTIGVGFIHSYLNYGKFTFTNSQSPSPLIEYEPEDSYNSISLGAGYKYFAYFNLGFSLKMFNSFLTKQITSNGIKDVKADGTSIDLGALVILPLSELWFNKTIFNNNGYSIKPKSNFSIGYAINNIGEKVYFIDPAQSDPLPRIARLGYNLNFGLDIQIKNVELNLIDYSFTGEADDILVKRDTTGVKYEGMFGKLIPGKHLISLVSDKNVVVHKAHTFSLFETITYSTGRVNGRQYQIIKTEGVGISTEGLLKLLCAFTENKVLNYITGHFTLEYSRANLNSAVYQNILPSNNRKYESISLYIKNFEF